MAAAVDHGTDLPCRGLHLLHQGIQRRIRITIVHEPTDELVWRDVRELVVGEEIESIEGGISVKLMSYHGKEVCPILVRE